MSNIFRLRIIVLAISIACLCQIPMVCSQQPGATAKKYSVRNLYAPSKNPDRIILTWSDDPATTQTVNWRTDSSVEQGYAEISEATDGPRFVRDLTRISSKIDELESSVGKSKYHHATFRDLKPSTKYVFRVGDGKNWSEFSQFTTASKTTEPFSFVYFGDAQNDIKSHWSRVVRESFKDAPRAKFFLHAGDLVNSANSEIEWGEWFYAAGWINRTIPSIATPGNHEYERGSLSRNWQPTFEFPKNGPEGFDDTVYYIDFQGVRIVSLNSNAQYQKQADWLNQTLSENPSIWTIVTFHHPVFSTARGRDNKELRDTFQPIFDRNRVDLVLQGHDHSYGRTSLLWYQDSDKRVEEPGGEESNVATGQNVRVKGGTVYVVSVSGPKMYGLSDKSKFQKAVENKQLYQIISIDGESLNYSARTATGNVVDEFELRKMGEGPNQLIETMVSSPKATMPNR